MPTMYSDGPQRRGRRVIPSPPRSAGVNGLRIRFALAVTLAVLLSGCLVASEDSPRPTPRATTSPAKLATRPALATPGAALSAVATAATAPPFATPVPTVATVGGTPAPGSARYTVQEGDTLSGLASRIGVPAAEIARLNGIAAEALLRTGQELQLPSGTWSDRLGIRLTSPQPGARVRSPIAVEGTAATFEGQVLIEVIGPDGIPVAGASATAAMPDPGRHGPFRAQVAVPAAGAEQQVVLRLYWRSPRDGAPTDDIRIPVILAP